MISFIAAANDMAAKLAAGTLTPERAKVAPTLIFNQQLDGWLTIFFSLLLWIVLLEMIRVSVRSVRGLPVPANSEAPYVATKLDPTTLGTAH